MSERAKHNFEWFVRIVTAVGVVVVALMNSRYATRDDIASVNLAIERKASGIEKSLSELSESIHLTNASLEQIRQDVSRVRDGQADHEKRIRSLEAQR